MKWKCTAVLEPSSLAGILAQGGPVAWVIHSWSAERGEGEVRSPHFGPFVFGANENVDGVQDFVEGEPVFVELDGHAPDFQVRVIRPFRSRQPAGTHWPDFDVVNGRFGDAMVEEHSPAMLQLWIGDCCEYCTPNPFHVRFEGVSTMVGLEDDLDLSSPLFRLASLEEVELHGLSVSPESKAFCIVTSHGQGADGPSIFVVAKAVRVLGPPGRSS